MKIIISCRPSCQITCPFLDVFGHIISLKAAQKIRHNGVSAAGTHNITCARTSNLFFHTQVRYKTLPHWSRFTKVRPCSLLPLPTEIWHRWHHTVGLASPRLLPAHPAQCVNRLCLRRISPPVPHCSIATAGNVPLESHKDSSSGLMKRCGWNNWAGTTFALTLFHKASFEGGIIFRWILLDFLS